MATLDPRTPTKAVFYFRTLDRWPGGNADMLTVKVTLRLEPDAAQELEVQFYRCFDGRHTWYPARRVALADGEALSAFLEVTRSLAARGQQTLAVRLLDAADDEWDSEWADSEVGLFASEGLETPDAALLRLVRRTAKQGPAAPDPEVERAFELAQQLAGIGRVFKFANIEDLLSARYWVQNGAEPMELDYVLETTPYWLPPEADAAFVELQAGVAMQRAAARAAEATRPECMLVYRIDEVPESLTRGLSPDASPRRCVLFSARKDSRFIDALFAEVPETEHDESDAAMDIAGRVSHIASMSASFARTLRPDQVPKGASILGGTYASGFHGGDAEEVERWLDARGVERVSLRTFLDQLILLRLVDEDGAPLERVDTFRSGPPVWTEDSIGDGLFVFERDRYVDFKLGSVFDDERSDEFWVKLRASDLPPGVVHTVIIPAAPAPKARAKQGAARKTGAKKTGAKKTAAGKTAVKKTGKKTAAKKAGKKTTAKKTAAKKAGKKTGAKKTAGKKTAAKKVGKKTAGKKTASKKTGAKKTASKRRPAK